MNVIQPGTESVCGNAAWRKGDRRCTMADGPSHWLAEECNKMPLSESELVDKMWTVAGFTHFMTGPELKAASLALNAFNAEYTSSDIKNYSVGVRETPDAFEVRLCPYADLENRPKDFIGYGEYLLGKEIHYTISKDEYKITRARVVP